MTKPVKIIDQLHNENLTIISPKIINNHKDVESMNNKVDV